MFRSARFSAGVWLSSCFALALLIVSCSDDDPGGTTDPPPAATCGNDNREGTEECDGTDLAGSSCADHGLSGDALACRDCLFDTSGCSGCGNGVCESNEAASDSTYDLCPADCAMVDVSTGRTHTCAVRIDGTVYCWGGAEGHRLGGMPDVNTPVAVPGIVDAVAVAAGDKHTCVLLGDGTAECWGLNGLGETGSGAMERYVFPPEPVDGVTGAVSISAGGSHTCALDGSGTAHCWGGGDFGEVGGGEFRLVNATPVSQPGAALALSAGVKHTCLLRADSVECFGIGLHGRLGTGTTLWWNTPTPVDLNPDWETAIGAIAAGHAHSCVRIGAILAQAPFVACWGWNGRFALGVDASNGPHLAVAVPGFEPETGAAPSPMAAGNGHTCARSAVDADVYCWGSNSDGQLGIGNTDTAAAGPHRVDGVNQPAVITARWFQTCAITEVGALYCWGSNSHGQLGHGSTDPHSAVPVAPVGL